MVIGLAITLIVLVVAGMTVLVSYEVMGRPRSEWHNGIKEWQQLTGAVLGLLGAAGVFILGTAIQTEQGRQQAFAVQHSIGRGLALEAERLTQGLKAGEIMAASMTFDGSDDDVRKCRLFMNELQRYLPPEAPVYKAVLERIADFGDTNLTWFVRFHGYYADTLRALEQSKTNACSKLTAQADVGYVASLINGALYFFNEIAQRYSDVVTPDDVQKILDEEVTPPIAQVPATTTAN